MTLTQWILLSMKYKHCDDESLISLVEIMGTDIKEFVEQEIKKQNDKFIREFMSNFSNESKHSKYKYKYKYKYKHKRRK